MAAPKSKRCSRVACMPDPPATRPTKPSFSESSTGPQGPPEGNLRPAEALTLPGPELGPAAPTPLSHSRSLSPSSSGPPGAGPPSENRLPARGASLRLASPPLRRTVPGACRGRAEALSLGICGSSREHKRRSCPVCRASALPLPRVRCDGAGQPSVCHATLVPRGTSADPGEGVIGPLCTAARCGGRHMPAVSGTHTLEPLSQVRFPCTTNSCYFLPERSTRFSSRVLLR